MRNVLGFSFHDKLNEENAFNHQHSLIICILELKPLSLHKTKKHTRQKIQLTDKNKKLFIDSSSLRHILFIGILE